MANTATTRLKFQKQAQGDNNNSWGTELNAGVIDMADEAIAGVEAVTLTAGATTTLTASNYVSNQARNIALVLSGTLTENHSIVIPTSEKIYMVINSVAMGAYTLTMKVSGGSINASLESGKNCWVYCDGTTTNVMARLDQIPKPTAALAMNSQKITGVGAATASTDAASLANRLDQFAAPTASVSMGSQKITSLATGTATTDGVNKAQMDAAIASAGIPAASGAVKITVADTTAQYLDGAVAVSGLLTKTVTNPGADETLTLDVPAATLTQIGAASSAVVAVTPSTLLPMMHAVALSFQ